MFLFIIGLIVLILGFVFSKGDSSLTKLAVGFKVFGALLVIIGIFWSCIVQIESGEVGVKKLFGKIDEDNLLTEGLNVVNPMVDVIKFDVKTQSYTMSGVHNEGDVQGNDAIVVLSKDGLEVTMDVTVLYKVLPSEAQKILKTIGIDYKDKIVRPITRTRMRDIAVYYDAVSLFSSKRDEFQNKIFSGISADFKSRGLVVEQILIRNINLPASVKTTIESKINAEQEAQKMQFVLQKEQQEAERKRVEAQGIADYHKIISTGLNERQLQYETIKMQKELANSPNSKIIIMGSGKGTPLMLNTN
ncbi:MAG: prohibitin family protein [Cytophagaceae bacterium]|jgi:regulator of protease activity HflC (stomatin/prohibitin superfamily)|nr:prohibitin family protein [Cytophagaceae bacterium]